MKTDIWKQGQFRLFISHKVENKRGATDLKRILAKYGISCFVAHVDIAPTKDWENVILDALRTMDGLIALFTPEFHKSKYADQELGFALGTDRFILPLRDGADPHGFIASIQGLTLQPGAPDDYNAREIVTLILNDDRTHETMMHALAKMLETSSSYKQSVEAVSLFEDIQTIPEELLRRIEEAKRNNIQVSDSIVAAPRIDRLVDRHRAKNAMDEIEW